MLIREGSQHYYQAKSGTDVQSVRHVQTVLDFEVLVDKLRAIMLEKIKFIERTAGLNEDMVVELIRGSGSSLGQGEGLATFIGKTLLETAECEKIVADASESDLQASTDLDEIIRENFLRKTRNRLHYKVLEYVWKCVQVLIGDHRSCLSEEDLIAMLRLLDGLSWDSATPYDEARTLPHFKPDFTAVLLEICDQTANVRIIKLVATVLSNAPGARTRPQVEALGLAGAEQLNRVLVKFAVFAEAGDQLLQAASKQGGQDLKKILDQVKKSFNLRLHLEPDRPQRKPKKEQESTEPLDSEKEGSIEDESAETNSGHDVLADCMQAQQASTTASGSDGSDIAKQKQARASCKIEIRFESGIDSFLQQQAQAILDAKKKDSQDAKMEIDEGNAKEDEENKVKLRDIAEKIFEEKFEEKYQDEVKTAATGSTPKTLATFKTMYAGYVKDSISFIEANLIYSKFISDESSFWLAVECSIQCQKRLIQKLDHFNSRRDERVPGARGVAPISRVFCERVQNFVTQKLARNCINLVSSSSTAAASELPRYISSCVAQLQVLKQYLRKVKDAEACPSLASSRVLQELVIKSVGDAKPFLLDVLNQISSIDVVNENGEAVLKFGSNQEDADQISSSREQNKDMIKLQPALLTDHRFQTNIWLVVQQVYEILCNAMRHANLPQLSPEEQQQFTKIKKEIEHHGQKVLLKDALAISSGGQENYIFVHNIDISRLIVQYFIRSTWVLEGLAQPAGEPAVSRSAENLQSLIKFTCQMIRISDSDNYYLVNGRTSQPSYVKSKVLKDDLVTFAYFLVRRLTLDNRGPNHPATYDATIISSDLFKEEIFGKIIQSPVERSDDAGAQAVDRYNNSRLKNVFIQFLGTICYNDPTQTPKVIENGIMKKVVDMLENYLPVHSVTIYVLFEFLRMVIVHEQGREFIKEHKVFDKLIRPCTQADADSGAIGNSKEDCNLAMVIQAANHEKYKKHTNLAISELIRASDDYFQETARKAVTEIITFLTPKAEFLQKKYYDYLTECTTGNTLVPKRHFQMEVTERLLEYADYHIIKFEMDKLHTLCYSSHHDSPVLLQYIFKLFTPEVIDQLLGLFEILSTIKPVFDFVQRGGADRQNSLFQQFIQIFNVLIHEGRNGQYAGGVERFEKRLRAACTNLANVFSKTNPASDKAIAEDSKDELSIKRVNLMDFLKHDATSEGETKIPDICLEHAALKSLGASNLRGFLIANVLIVGQYITVFEGTRKPTQESLCVTKEWSRELQILSSFMTAFNECNHKITDEFFKDQKKFVSEGVVTEDQIEGISILYTNSLTLEEKTKFAETRKQIEENIDLYRENMTYLDPEYININRLLHIVWEFWRAPPQRRQEARGNSVDEQIIASKKSYTKLTIDNIKDMDRVIDEFERLRGDFNSTDFLTTISRLYTYISELQQLIANEKLCGITFYQFVEQGCLHRLVQVFNIIKTFSLKKYGLEQDSSKQIKFIAVDCITSINKQLKNVLTQFINCSQSLITASTPSMPELIKEDGLYESTQHFFTNYVYDLVEQLVHQEATESTISNAEQGIPLYENKDLRQVQILLLQSISNGFEKCKFLKDEYGGSQADANRPDGARGEPARPKKVHHDEALIGQITCMGFERKLAKKALKLTGDVGNAVTFLLESGEAGLAAVPDSEDEEQQKSEQDKKDQHDKQALDEADAKVAEERKQERKAKLISVSDFKEYWKRVQEKGLTVVTQWSTFSSEEAKMVPYRTQRKYAKLFDQYVLSLAKSSGKTEKELTTIFDKVLDAYIKTTAIITAQQLPASASQPIDSMIVLYQDAKNHLTLLNRLIRLDSYKPILRLNRHERESKLIEHVAKTLRSLTASTGSAAKPGLMQSQLDEVSRQPDKVKFIYLSNVLELLYKSLLLYLAHQQTMISKKTKCEHNIRHEEELEKREKQKKDNDVMENAPRDEKHTAATATLRQKQQSVIKKFEELDSQKVAQDTLKFIQLLQQNSSRLMVPKKYTSELNLVIGQVVDIARIVLLQRIGDNKQAAAKQHDQASASGSADAPETHLVLPSGEHQSTLSMTTGTATLNIIQIQKLAFSEERVQSQLEFLIKRMTEVRAEKIARYNKSKEEQDEDKSIKSGKSKQSEAAEAVKFEQKDTIMDFKAFFGEFQAQVLGVGKASGSQHQNRPPHYGGGPPPAQQNLSQPSNEQANQLFSKIFLKAVKQTCDVVVRQEKAPPGEDEKAQQKLLKNNKEALNSSKIRLKKAPSQASEQPSGHLESHFEANDEKIYKLVFGELQACTRPWLAELKEFVEKQKPGSSSVNKMIIQEAEYADNGRVSASADVQEQWRELTLVQLRNLSSLARVYVDRKNGFIEAIIAARGNRGESGESTDLDLIEWIKQVYLPLRLVKRHVTTKTEESKTTHEIWYELDQSSSIEKLDRNLCLLLNELMGWGHFYGSEAREQRQTIRHALLVSCLDTLRAQAQDVHGVGQLSVIGQAQLLSCLLLIQHLTNQFNQFEYNRVVLSRQCYSQSIRVLFDYGQGADSGQSLRLVPILNMILNQVVKLPASSNREIGQAAEDSEVKAFASLQTLSTLVIERSIKIFTTIALFLEGEKKREKQLKEEQKRKKELQLARNKKKMDTKKDKEQDKDKTSSNKEAEGDGQQQPGARGAEAKAGEAGSGSQDRGLSHGQAATGLNEAGSSLVDGDGTNARPNDEAQSPVDALMNADSDDDDDDVHGEGSQSQQHDLQLQENQLQQQQLINADGHIDGVQEHAIGGLQAPGIGNFDHDDGEYGDDQDHEDEAVDGEDDDDQDDDLDDGDQLDDEEIIIQQQVNMHGGHDPNAMMVDEEDEDEELMEGEMEEEEGDEMDGDDQDDDDEMEAGFDELPSDEDDGALFLPPGMRGQHGRHRAGGRNQQNNQRDILFNVPDGGAGLLGGPGERMRLERAGGGYAHAFVDIRDGGAAQARGADGAMNYGPNWSREEEEVSQTLRNLRGLSINNGGSPAANQIPNQGNQVNLLQQQNYRYQIELEASQQFADSSKQQLLAQAKKSIEQIKLEQAKPLNNQLSTIFQILKPIDLQGQCALAQAIDQEFLKGAVSRESRRIDDEKQERQERLERIRKGQDLPPADQEREQVLQLGWYGDDSDEEDAFGAALQGSGGPGALHPPAGLFQEILAGGAGRGGPASMIQDRLLGIRMDIERLLQEGAAAGLRDPILDQLEDPFGLGGLFGGGGPGYPPRHLQRDRERADQANARRDAREQAVNWGLSLFSAPEATAQDNAQNMIQAMIDDGQVVIDEIEPQLAAVGEEDAKSSEMSHSQSRPSQSQSQEEEERKSSQNPVPTGIPEPPVSDSQNRPAEAANRPQAAASQFQEINDFMAGLRMDQESRGDQQQQPQPDQGENQAMLASFFGSLNQPGQPAAPNQAAGQANAPEVQDNGGNNDALHGGMNGMNRAIDDIRVEIQSNMQRLDQAVERLGGQGGAEQPNQPDQPQVQPPVDSAPEVIGSSLADHVIEQQQPTESQPNQSEEKKEGEGQAAAQEQANAEQQQVQAIVEEEMTFGYPNSLLKENDIEPAMLFELPEEVRAEILSTIQDQFEEWQKNRQNQQDSAQASAVVDGGPSQEQQADGAQANADPAQEAVPIQAPAEPEAPGQIQEEVQPAQQQEQAPEELDPEVAQAIAMGLDADFIANLPPEMRRELIQNESFRAANTGASQPNRPPQREPEAMDVASIIATVQDPTLRSEMLQSLSEEQINGLPSALRTEALNARAGRRQRDIPGGGLFGAPPHHGHIPRPPRHGEQMDELINRQMLLAARGDGEELERMGLLMNRMYRGAGHLLEDGEPRRKVLVDPKEVAFDKLLMEYTAELDLQLQDELLQSEKSENNDSFFNKVQEQLLGGKEQGQSGTSDYNDDKLLKNVLTTICLNPNVKTDIVQFLRLMLKHKSQMQGSANSSQSDNQHGYQFRNKIINTLTFVMKIAAQKDTAMLLALFEIEIPEAKKATVKVSNLQWNKIFLTVVGILRVLIDNNKKLILHMLKCLIQKDEYFVNKGDHLVSSHARLLETLGEGKSLRPPLAEIIQIMRDQSEQHHKLSKKPDLSEDEKKLCLDQLVRVRNVKLLIQDVFKQFDLLFDDFDEIARQQQLAARSQNGKKNAAGPQQGINLGELTPDAVQSLTDLLFLPSMDKKLLTTLGDFMLKLMLGWSNQKDFSNTQKYEEKNLRNWSMITEQCQNIAQGNLGELNDLLLEILMTFSTFGLKITTMWNRTASQLERAHSQLSSGGRQASGVDQAMDSNGVAGAAAALGLPQPRAAPASTPTQKMTPEQEAEFKQLLARFKADSAPLTHVLSLYSLFFTKFTAEKVKLESQAEAIKQQIKPIEDEQQAANSTEAAKKTDEASTQEVQDAAAKKEVSADAVNPPNPNGLDEAKAKELVDLKKRLDGCLSSLNQKEACLGNIKSFFQTETIALLVQQSSQILAIIQQTNVELIDSAKNMVNNVFDCFMTEMYDEVIKGIEERERKLAAANTKKDSRRPGQAAEASAAQDGEDSRYVQMEPIQKIAAATVDQQAGHAKTTAEADRSSLAADAKSTTTPTKLQIVKSTSEVGQSSSAVKSSSMRRTTVFRDVEVASDRLYQFNLFCLQNRTILNKLVKNIYSAAGREREGAQKDIGTVCEFIKHMPNLLDFENKRLHFKREIKKLRRASYARDLTLYIRRGDIFMDAFSQLCHLTANELKGRISVEFTGEKGQDVGGLTRDFFTELSKEMFNQNYSLFKHSDNGSTYMPNPKSYVQQEHIRYFQFIGRVIGKALFEGCLLECYFVRSLYKMLIGQKLNFQDLEDFDNNLYVGLNWCLQPSSDVEVLCEAFSTREDYFGRTEEIDLIPGGRDIDLTNENKEYYVERKAYYHLYKSVQQQIDAFLDGFYEIIPRDLVAIFTYKELELLISGLPDFKITDLKASTNYNGYTANSPQIQWFWEVMEELDRAEKGNLLQFVTGSSKVPVDGFANLQGMNGPEPFQITRIVTNDPMRLPQGHTCFNQLDLPEYPSREVLRERLMWAITETSGFGFA